MQRDRPTVKVYVEYDHNDKSKQDLWAFPTAELAEEYRVFKDSKIYEIEMREVTPNQKRDKGWAIASGSNGRLYGHGGYGVSDPFVFGDKFVADELAKKLGIGDTAIEVYADTLEPVDGE